MFVQVVQAHTSDAEGVRRMFDRWVLELGGDATGWLGTTAGVTHDGQLVAIARFDSEENARRNSDRPEQGAWYEELTKHLDGDVTFHDCTEVDTGMGGGSDEAGFVQVIQSRVLDHDRLREIGKAMDAAAMNSFRPDVLGGFVAIHGNDDGMTQVVYFTSEGEAREGEKADPPPEMAEAMAGWDQVVTDTQYFDLRDPWLASPR